MKLFESFPSRIVIFVGMMLQIVALAMFTESTSYGFQLFARFLSGFSQVILSIFLPVWVDAFSPREKKTKWMTLIITAAPGGLFVGYSMTACIVMFDISWWWAFYIHILMLIPVSNVFFAIKETYLDVQKRAQQQAAANEQEIQIVDPDMPQPPSEVKKEDSDASEFEKWQIAKNAKELSRTKDFHLQQKFKYVLTNPDYVLNMLSITCLFLTVTAIQFWMTDYMVQVMDIPQNQAFKVFATASLCAPVSGVICGGILFSKLGGYNSYKSLHAIPMVSTIALICGLIGSATSNFKVFVSVMALQLFFGGMLVPAATGIMLNQVPQNMRTVCNSVANMSYNLLGYVPAPYAYGYMYQKHGQGKNHAGFYTIEAAATLGYLLGLVFFLRKKWMYSQFRKQSQLDQAYQAARSSPVDSADTAQKRYNRRGSDVDASDSVDNSE